MLFRAIAVLSLLAFSHSCVAADSAHPPAAIAKQLERMVGSWAFAGSEGDRHFSGREKIRLTNDGNALLQEGYFELEDGKKEHYVILSGWDSDRGALIVHGFTSTGQTFEGDWKAVKDSALHGSANGRPAAFRVNDKTMTYEEDGGKWISKFERIDSDDKPADNK